MEVKADVAAMFKEGIRLCRKDKWREGYDVLARVAQQVEKRGNLPGVFYSYLGVAMARCEGRRRDGMELCRYALQLQPDGPENYLNLAEMYLMLGRRESAVTMVGQGLIIQPAHVRLQEMRTSLGVRRRPIFPFLSRKNPLNSLIGRLRAWGHARRRALQERRDEIALFGA